MRPETELLAKTRQIAFHLNASVVGREDMPTLAAGIRHQAAAGTWLGLDMRLGGNTLQQLMHF